MRFRLTSIDVPKMWSPVRFSAALASAQPSSLRASLRGRGWLHALGDQSAVMGTEFMSCCRLGAQGAWDALGGLGLIGKDRHAVQHPPKGHDRIRSAHHSSWSTQGSGIWHACLPAEHVSDFYSSSCRLTLLQSRLLKGSRPLL